MRNAFLIAEDLSNDILALRGTLPAVAPSDESAAEFRRRIAVQIAIRHMEEAVKELRGEPTEEQLSVQAAFAFACGG
jgi:hypothetical protein